MMRYKQSGDIVKSKRKSRSRKPSVWITVAIRYRRITVIIP